MKNYYAILGVSPSATAAEIKRAYRKLAVMYHPDKNADPAAEQFFKEVNEAYNILGDHVKRIDYDDQLRNPLAQFFPEEEPRPVHRDPAYRRRRPAPPRAHKPTKLDLMKAYLPYFRWLIYAGLVLMAVFAIDFLLPTKMENEIVYATRHVEMRSAFYDVIKTNRRNIKIYNWHPGFVVSEGEIIVEYTPVLNAVIRVSSVDGKQSMPVGGIYSALMFIPFVMFAISIAGFILRNNIEYAFNLSVINGILIIIVIYLIFSS